MAIQEDIHQIIEQVCTMMLGASIEPIDAIEPAAPHDRITGCVQITGQWSGVVMLQTTNAFVTLAASQMLALKEHELSLADRQDAVAELTNMIGGNIKSLVPGPSCLSLPSVTIGKEFDIRLYGTVLDTVVPVCCQGERMCVLLYRGENSEPVTAC